MQSPAHGKNSLQCYRLGTEWLGNSSVEKDPRALVDLKLNVSRQYAQAVSWAIQTGTLAL